jgi:signal transduction histidine kinase
VIVITGYADLEGTITALRYGAADYLLKPINPDLLRAAIARVARIQSLETRALQAERLAAIGQMATVLTHESGNILGRGQAVLELLSSRVRSQPEPLELVEELQKVFDDLKRLHEHIRNFAAPIHLERTSGSLDSIWREVCKNLQTTAAQHHKTISVVERIEGTDLACDVDYFRMRQVFRNLFENSIAACPNPVQIEIACSETTLRDLPALRIAIRDNGPGLTREQRTRMFEPFYTTKAKGTGLGMAIVKRIIEAHGGEVSPGNSATHQGAEIVIILPRAG